MTEFSGRHVLAEMRGVDPALLNDADFLSGAVRSAVTRVGATVCEVVSHRFEPNGVTVVALLAESHASVHTYPEFGALFADVFTCGERADPERAVRLLAEALGCDRVLLSTVDRGRGGAVSERLGAGLSRRWEISDVLFEAHTGFQNLLIARTGEGVALFCDDERQSTEASQLIYHEALLVPAMLLAERTRRVLIIGSSEGVLSRIAADEGAEVDHVDIDRVAVRACAEHLPYGYTPETLKAAERGQGPIRVHYQDGWEFVAGSDGGYDLVLIDLPDEDPAAAEQSPGKSPEPHDRLYSTGFLRRCAGLLTPEGVVASQAGCAVKGRNDTLIRAWQRFGEVFGTTVYYGSDEHVWSFLSGRLDEVADPVAVMTERLGKLRYRPETIDAEALRGNTVPPLGIRSA